MPHHFKKYLHIVVYIVFLVVVSLSSVPVVSAYVQTLTTVQIQPGSLSLLSPNQTIFLSALGFDQLGNPIFSGVTYQWGLSSTGSVGQLRPDATGKTAILTVSGSGSGDLYVVAKQGSTELTRSILISTNQGPTTCPADVSGDNVVNLQDYTLLSGSFMKQRSQLSNPNIDIDNSGVVDLKDYSILVSRFMQPC